MRHNRLDYELLCKIAFRKFTFWNVQNPES